MLFWLGMASDIDMFVASCDVCNKYHQNNESESLHLFPITTQLWQPLHTDILASTFNKLINLITFTASHTVVVLHIKIQNF